MVLTPAAVCTMTGNSAAIKIRKIGEALPTPNQRMDRGIHAMGEMGRRICTRGLSVSCTLLTRPIHNPSGMAMLTARKNPAPTRISEEPMWSHRLPSFTSSKVPLSTAQGVGKIKLFVASTVHHHAPITSASIISGGIIFLSFSTKYNPWFQKEEIRPYSARRNKHAQHLFHAPLKTRPAQCGLRIDDHRHLSADMGSARKLVLRGQVKRQCETLARHDQRRAEHLRHLVQIFQYQRIAYPKGEIDPLRS